MGRTHNDTDESDRLYQKCRTKIIHRWSKFFFFTPSCSAAVLQMYMTYNLVHSSAQWGGGGIHLWPPLDHCSCYTVKENHVQIVNENQESLVRLLNVGRRPAFHQDDGFKHCWKSGERWAASAFTFPHDLLIENRWRDKSVPRSQHILCNCTNSVKRRMDVDDRIHPGLITVLNKITWLSCFGCMCQQECDQHSSWWSLWSSPPGQQPGWKPLLGLSWFQALVSLWRTDTFVAATSSSDRSVSAVERIIYKCLDCAQVLNR